MTDTTTAPFDVDTLPPTQGLILGVLAARHRLGEHLWTFPNRPAIVAAADQLGKLGLVGWKGGVGPKTVEVWLTDAGRAAVVVDGYVLPNERHATSDGLHAYLALGDRGGIGWVGLDHDRVDEYARNTGSVVVQVPVIADYRTGAQPG